MAADIKDVFAFSAGRPPRATKAPLMCAGVAALLTLRLPFYLFFFFVFLMWWKHGSNGVSCLDMCLLFSLGGLLIGNPLRRKFCLSAAVRKKLHQIFSPPLLFFRFGLYLFVYKMKNLQTFCFGAPAIRRIYHPAADRVAQRFRRFKSGVGFNSPNLYEIWFHAWQVVHAARTIT